MHKALSYFPKWIVYLLPDPLGNKVVAKDDNGGAGNKPKRVKAEKRIIEATLRNKVSLFLCWFKICHLLWVVLECEEGGVDEHEPADHPHDHQAIPKHRVVEIKHLGWFSCRLSVLNASSIIKLLAECVVFLKCV